jgi:hypothetical protein
LCFRHGKPTYGIESLRIGQELTSRERTGGQLWLRHAARAAPALLTRQPFGGVAFFELRDPSYRIAAKLHTGIAQPRRVFSCSSHLDYQE